MFIFAQLLYDKYNSDKNNVFYDTRKYVNSINEKLLISTLRIQALLVLKEENSIVNSLK